MQRTSLYEFHLQNNGRMVEFAGWEMPVMYGSIVEEHNWCRNHAAAFDVSHMGRLEFRGGGAEAFLQRICTRNLGQMPAGLSRYGHVCRDDGGILDDVIVSRFDGHFGMVCNASNREKLLGWFEQQRRGFDVEITDITADTAMIAIQGPEALDLLGPLLKIDLKAMKRYHFVQSAWQGANFTVYRSGYSGEDGAEIVMPAGLAPMAAAFFLLKSAETGKPVKLAGLGARDSLRLEAGMPLYGHELTEEWDSLTAGQKWCVDLSKDFIGRDAMQRLENAGLPRVMAGFEVEGRRAARQGTRILHNSREVGFVTSGALTPTIGKVIAMGFIEKSLATIGTMLEMDIRGDMAKSQVVPIPFYKRPK